MIAKRTSIKGIYHIYSRGKYVGDRAQLKDKIVTRIGNHVAINDGKEMPLRIYYYDISDAKLLIKLVCEYIIAMQAHDVVVFSNIEDDLNANIQGWENKGYICNADELMDNISIEIDHFDENKINVIIK